MLHSWNLDPEEALRLQTKLREQLVLTWAGHPVSTIGGVDVGIVEDQGYAAIVVLSYPEMQLQTSATAHGRITFPYIPGLLAFREGPLILEAWGRLPIQPDLLMFDGQGIAHPRCFGLASHLGLWLDKPAIGVAKSRLCGRYNEVSPLAGELKALYDEHDSQRIIGAVLRMRQGVKPVFISPGHLIDLENSIALVRASCRVSRLPEPTRQAHLLTVQCKRNMK